MTPFFLNYEYHTEDIHVVNCYVNEPKEEDNGIEYTVLRTTYKPNPDGTVKKESKYI